MRASLPWRQPLDPPQRTLSLAFALSLLLHAFVLSIHFRWPLPEVRERAPTLDVVLVNSRQAKRPEQPQARAQANLDGGGQSERPVRAQTPLPPARTTQTGDQLIEAQARVAQLEQQQRELMTRATPAPQRMPSAAEAAPAPAPTLSGRDLALSARAQLRLEAEIARSLEEYNQRPRRKFIGVRVEEYRFAQYVEDWRLKVERVGNLNYPEAARGKLYGNLVLTVAIKSDGSLERVELNRSSGHKVLDEAARRIVELAAPFAAFPDNIRRDTDIIEITRTWSFTSSDQLRTQ